MNIMNIIHLHCLATMSHDYQVSLSEKKKMPDPRPIFCEKHNICMHFDDISSENYA